MREAWQADQHQSFCAHSARLFRPKAEKRPGEGPVVLATLTTGPVFPIVKGKKAGEKQGKRSHVREPRH